MENLNMYQLVKRKLREAPAKLAPGVLVPAGMGILKLQGPTSYLKKIPRYEAAAPKNHLGRERAWTRRRVLRPTKPLMYAPSKPEKHTCR